MSNATAPTRNSEIATEILRQLGGRHFVTLTGAKHLLAREAALTFRLDDGFAKDGINFVQVRLAADDTYTMTFQRLTGAAAPVTIHEDVGVYCDMLRDLFEDRTGLYTSLRPRRDRA